MRLIVHTDEGSVEVQAKRYTLLAIHRRPDYSPELHADQWTISHIPTGLTLLSELGLDDAVRLAQALEGLDWNFVDDTIPQLIQDQACKIIESVKAQPGAQPREVSPPAPPLPAIPPNTDSPQAVK